MQPGRCVGLYYYIRCGLGADISLAGRAWKDKKDCGFLRMEALVLFQIGRGQEDGARVS